MRPFVQQSEFLPKLRRMGLYGVAVLTREAVHELRRARPHLRVVANYELLWRDFDLSASTAESDLISEDWAFALTAAAAGTGMSGTRSGRSTIDMDLMDA